jgi:hypothetical protein
VNDLAFYEVGCDDARGPRRLLVLARRALRRVLRPFFLRLVAILQALCARLDATEAAASPRPGPVGRPDDAYRLALLAERLSRVLVQESLRQSA